MSLTSGWLRRVGYRLLAHTDQERVDVDGRTLKQVLASISLDLDSLINDNVINKQNIALNAEGVEEAKALAKEMNNALVFVDTEEMETYFKDPDNKKKHPVGTNVYIIAVDEDDKWISKQLDIPNLDGMYYELQLLESQVVRLDEYEKAKNYLYRALCNSEYSDQQVYRLGSYVRYNYVVYKNNVEIDEPESFDPEKWDEVDIASQIENAVWGDEDKVIAADIVGTVDAVDISTEIKLRLLQLEAEMANRTTYVTTVSPTEIRIRIEDEDNGCVIESTTITDGSTVTVNKTVTTPDTEEYNYVYSSVTTQESADVVKTVESYSRRIKTS